MPSIPQSQSIDQISYLIPVIIMVILMLLWVPVTELLRSRREREREREAARSDREASTAGSDEAALPQVRSERVTLTSPVDQERDGTGPRPGDSERETEAAGRL
jgi:flagellar biosynthesis/type III secretory pathway M-ring protein FliF/YscJ